MKTVLQKTSRLTALLIFIFILQSSKPKNKKMKITENQPTPGFTLTDVNGKNVNLSDYKGKKLLLSFYRNVGCPVCNLRFHELQEESDYFKTKGLILFAVYESTAENMKMYLEGENPYAIMIPNPDESLYNLYELEKNMGKVMKGMFYGAMKKMKKGKQLFKTKIKQDGNANRLGADFLIDEKGNIRRAYYAKYVGDHLPMAEIRKLIN